MKRLCECGCGGETSGKVKNGVLVRYISGHQQRGKKYPYKARLKAIGRKVWNKGIKGMQPWMNTDGLKLGVLYHVNPPKGEKNPTWKGDKISKIGVHQWMYREFGKASKCEFCGLQKSTYDWANISNQYLRDRGDWLELCKSCHRYFDRYKWEYL